MKLSKTLFLFCASVLFFPGIFSQDYDKPPGVIINHIPSSADKYIGSPSICILPNGDYVASHDEFGPKSSEYKSAQTFVFKSSDRGETWSKVSQIDGQFWSNLFLHKGNLYIMGTNKHHGNLIIRKSIDNGSTWTNPYDAKNGLLLEGEYHTAPVPVLIHKGRIWRAIEYATAKSTKWGERYSAVMLSAPLNSDLLQAKNWTRSNHLGVDQAALYGDFKTWLEGNAVATKEGRVVDILRVHAPALKEEYCAIINVDKKGKKISFNKENFFKMPGASKKFTIRYDETSGLYWSLVNYVEDTEQGIQLDRVRNTVALISSEDLRKWDVKSIVLAHPDLIKHAFQYVDWLFDGNDIVYVSRTASDDEEGGAKAAHDANFLTFHRIDNFRETTIINAKNN